MGSVVRRRKEQKHQEKRQLAGHAGKLLYLEALQLLMRKQILWLVNEAGHKEELETVVRDLWDLRIRGVDSTAPDESSAEGALEMFSSQAQPDTDKVSWKSRSRAQSWDPERGSDWPLPRVQDTVVLCYLGCLLLRIPTRIGELLGWVNQGKMPYRRVVGAITCESEGYANAK